MCKGRATEPEFINESSFFVVDFKFNRPLTTLVTEQASEQVSKQASEQVSKQVQSLLLLLKSNLLTTKEIMEGLGKKSREYVRSHYIKEALNKGYIAQQYPDNPNAPNQKYYLTDKGTKYLATLE